MPPQPGLAYPLQREDATMVLNVPCRTGMVRSLAPHAPLGYH